MKKGENKELFSEREPCKIVLKKDVAKKANKISCRFVLPIKNTGTENKVCKPMFAVQIFTDLEKHFQAYASANL